MPYPPSDLEHPDDPGGEESKGELGAESGGGGGGGELRAKPKPTKETKAKLKSTNSWDTLDDILENIYGLHTEETNDYESLSEDPTEPDLKLVRDRLVHLYMKLLPEKPSRFSTEDVRKVINFILKAKKDKKPNTDADIQRRKAILNLTKTNGDMYLESMVPSIMFVPLYEYGVLQEVPDKEAAKNGFSQAIWNKITGWFSRKPSKGKRTGIDVPKDNDISLFWFIAEIRAGRITIQKDQIANLPSGKTFGLQEDLLDRIHRRLKERFEMREQQEIMDLIKFVYGNHGRVIVVRISEAWNTMLSLSARRDSSNIYASPDKTFTVVRYRTLQRVYCSSTTTARKSFLSFLSDRFGGIRTAGDVWFMLFASENASHIVPCPSKDYEPEKGKEFGEEADELGCTDISVLMRLMYIIQDPTMGIEGGEFREDEFRKNKRNLQKRDEATVTWFQTMWNHKKKIALGVATAASILGVYKGYIDPVSWFSSATDKVVETAAEATTKDVCDVPSAIFDQIYKVMGVASDWWSTATRLAKAGSTGIAATAAVVEPLRRANNEEKKNLQQIENDANRSGVKTVFDLLSGRYFPSFSFPWVSVDERWFTKPDAIVRPKDGGPIVTPIHRVQAYLMYIVSKVRHKSLESLGTLDAGEYGLTSALEDLDDTERPVKRYLEKDVIAALLSKFEDRGERESREDDVKAREVAKKIDEIVDDTAEGAKAVIDSIDTGIEKKKAQIAKVDEILASIDSVEATESEIEDARGRATDRWVAANEALENIIGEAKLIEQERLIREEEKKRRVEEEARKVREEARKEAAKQQKIKALSDEGANVVEKIKKKRRCFNNITKRLNETNDDVIPKVLAYIEAEKKLQDDEDRHHESLVRAEAALKTIKESDVASTKERMKQAWNDVISIKNEFKEAWKKIPKEAWKDADTKKELETMELNSTTSWNGLKQLKDSHKYHPSAQEATKFIQEANKVKKYFSSSKTFIEDISRNFIEGISRKFDPEVKTTAKVKDRAKTSKKKTEPRDGVIGGLVRDSKQVQQASEILKDEIERQKGKLGMLRFVVTSLESIMEKEKGINAILQKIRDDAGITKGIEALQAIKARKGK